MITGYLHPAYADSLSEFGLPYELPACGGWILKRRIPDFSDFDAMGCYPIFACQDWSRLHQDLNEINDDPVCLGLVTDPFGDYDQAYLRRCFSDVMIPFKEHFIVDYAAPVWKISSHHRYYMRKARQEMQIEVCDDPVQHLDDWESLYKNLIIRNGLKGIKTFSRAAFTKQLVIPGVVMLRASRDDVILGAMIWFIQESIGYSHLTAISEAGYQLRASYGLYGYAIEYFASRVRYLDLGAGAGLVSDETDGLTLFKSGWTSMTRTAYFCGRIFNPSRYAAIAEARGQIEENYFPSYRRGEFA